MYCTVALKNSVETGESLMPRQCLGMRLHPWNFPTQPKSTVLWIFNPFEHPVFHDHAVSYDVPSSPLWQLAPHKQLIWDLVDSQMLSKVSPLGKEHKTSSFSHNTGCLNGLRIHSTADFTCVEQLVYSVP